MSCPPPPRPWALGQRPFSCSHHTPGTGLGDAMLPAPSSQHHWSTRHDLTREQVTRLRLGHPRGQRHDRPLGIPAEPSSPAALGHLLPLLIDGLH